MNYNRMLRPGGRIISINAAKPDVHGAYTGLSAEWFLDYYAINDFADCQIYAQFNFPSGSIGHMTLDYLWISKQGRAPPLNHDGAAFIIVVAEKSKASTWDRMPVRAAIRGSAEQTQWLGGAIARF